MAMLRSLFMLSSSSVYGDHPVLPKVRGSRREILLSPYALTKRVDEEYGKLYYKVIWTGYVWFALL